jgi:hypothetical protein
MITLKSSRLLLELQETSRMFAYHQYGITYLGLPFANVALEL